MDFSSIYGSMQNMGGQGGQGGDMMQQVMKQYASQRQQNPDYSLTDAMGDTLGQQYNQRIGQPMQAMGNMMGGSSSDGGGAAAGAAASDFPSLAGACC